MGLKAIYGTYDEIGISWILANLTLIFKSFLTYISIVSCVKKKTSWSKNNKKCFWSTLNKYRLINLSFLSNMHTERRSIFTKIVRKYAEDSKQKLWCYLLLQLANQYGGIFFPFLKG